MLFEKCLRSVLDLLIAKENEEKNDELEPVPGSTADTGSALERVAER